MKLEGRVALVTGAGRGIGREIALAFAGEGADVVVNDVSPELARSSVDAIEGLGRRALAAPADVSEERPVEDMVEASLETFGKVDVLVNNAGILSESPLIEMPVSEWDRMIKVDLRSVFLCAKAVAPSMIERRAGRIINVASQLGIKGRAGLTHYCAAKAGIIGFTKALALELGRYGITVNSIAPGPIDTDLVAPTPGQRADLEASLPLGRFGGVREVAPTAVLLASDPDGNLYTGQTLGPNSGDVMP